MPTKAPKPTCVTRSKASALPSSEKPWSCPKLIPNWKSLGQWTQFVKQNGAHLIVTNGCFDVLHPGHVKFLRLAKATGTFLLVLLNSDRSVRELKGPQRPINNQLDRALVLNELECVTGIYIFDDKRATSCLELTKPHVWAKGGDYTLDTLDPGEVEAVRLGGGGIAVIPAQGDIPTTKILQAGL